MKQETSKFKKLFFNRCNEHIKRNGINDLLSWLDSTESNFFTSPASTKFHGHHEGGLVDHSILVASLLHEKTIQYIEPITTFFLPSSGKTFSNLVESVYIIGLFHDLCKINCYYETKDAFGEFIYKTRNPLPLGHGEKSIYLLQQYINLTELEALCIRWHLGPFDGGRDKWPYYYDFNTAFDQKCLEGLMVNLTFMSDFEASVIEKFQLK